MLGIFDSGSGGLTVLRAIRALSLPYDIVYFGDLANAPYGNKSPAELLRLTEAGIARLAGTGVTHFVSACNSASASFLEGAAGTQHVLEMTRPTARMMRHFAGKSVLLVGTVATVAATSYDDALRPIVRLTKCALPELAGVIERGGNEQQVRDAIVPCLPQGGQSFDVVLLACTHYPFVKNIFEKICTERYGSHCVVLDPADAVADEISKSFPHTGNGTMRFLISKDSTVFRDRVAEIADTAPYTVEVV